MRKIHVLGFAAALLMFAGMAHAYPTLTGPTGLAVIPNAKLAPSGLSIAADWRRLESDSSSVTLPEESIPVRALFRFGGRIELGAMYDPFVDQDIFDSVMGANAKIHIWRLFGGDVAIGAQVRREEFTDGTQTDYEQAYFAWTTDFDAETMDASNIAFTWGLNWTKVNPDVGADASDIRAFLGARVAITDNCDLLGEFQSQNSSLGDENPITAATLRYRFSDNVASQVGITNAFGLNAASQHNFFAGLYFGFPGSSRE